MALSLAEDVETQGAFPPESRPFVQLWVKSINNTIPGLQSRQQNFCSDPLQCSSAHGFCQVGWPVGLLGGGLVGWGVG